MIIITVNEYQSLSMPIATKIVNILAVVAEVMVPYVEIDINVHSLI